MRSLWASRRIQAGRAARAAASACTNRVSRAGPPSGAWRAWVAHGGAIG